MPTGAHENVAVRKRVSGFASEGGVNLGALPGNHLERGGVGVLASG
ncbi:hypothetical protein FHU41_001236 [Psychromicrobium silvestre]|uniref:Uncharacterized protein n=1 Tax=Psychromicrobium silvestre TaxID=1645614 RepID=A0A7Y9S6H8_9MICC|nr:hypothetical protein [Psychromicrobium silvestre]